VEVQRCQIHKRRNVKEYLPENCLKDYDRRMRNAYAMNNYAEAMDCRGWPRWPSVAGRYDIPRLVYCYGQLSTSGFE
jgi:hypothetical protein